MDKQVRKLIGEIKDPVLGIFILVLLGGISTLYGIQIYRYSQVISDCREQRTEAKKNQENSQHREDSLHRVIEMLSRNNDVLGTSIEVLMDGLDQAKNENKYLLQNNVKDLKKIREKLKA